MIKRLWVNPPGDSLFLLSFSYGRRVSFNWSLEEVQYYILFNKNHLQRSLGLTKFNVHGIGPKKAFVRRQIFQVRADVVIEQPFPLP